MKKLIYILTIPLLFITRVHATTNYSYPNAYELFDDSAYVLENYSSYIDDTIELLSSTYGNIYSDYVILLNTGWANDARFVDIIPTTSNVFYYSSDDNTNMFSFDSLTSASGTKKCSFKYKENGDYISSPSSSCYSANLTSISYTHLPLKTSRDFTYYNASLETAIEIPSFSNSSYSFPTYVIGVNENLPTYETLLGDSYVVNPNENYVDINLKNYDYIVLSLRNYNIDSFTTPIYTLGSLCLTRVNNYGMTEVNSTIAGYKTPPCSDYFTSSTPVNLYIDSSMISSKPVWYIKSPADERPNVISVDTSIFNINYVNSSNANNPTALIDGRDYPIIPYDSLTDTAIISTNEGYISGQVCSPFDNNCILNQSGINDFNDIFTHPLNVLKTMWSGINSIFTIIATFISLLPVGLQTFLYISFTFGIILGIVKIIL